MPLVCWRRLELILSIDVNVDCFGQMVLHTRRCDVALQCTDDSNYVGDYRRGKRHGYGVYSFPNGDQYLGEYEDDIPQVHILE